MNLFQSDPERHTPGRTPIVKREGKPSTSIKAVTPGFRQRVTQGVRNGNYARMGLKKLFGT
jgi:hypothetical protein